MWDKRYKTYLTIIQIKILGFCIINFMFDKLPCKLNVALRYMLILQFYFQGTHIRTTWNYLNKIIRIRKDLVLLKSAYGTSYYFWIHVFHSWQYFNNLWYYFFLIKIRSTRTSKIVSDCCCRESSEFVQLRKNNFGQQLSVPLDGWEEHQESL